MESLPDPAQDPFALNDDLSKAFLEFHQLRSGGHVIAVGLTAAIPSRKNQISVEVVIFRLLLSFGTPSTSFDVLARI